MAKSRLEHTRTQRLEKITKLKSLGINPYPAQSQKDQPNQFVVDNLSQFENKNLTLTGRIASLRTHGQIIFIDLEDFSGTIQVFIRANDFHPTDKTTQTLGFDHLNLIDPGDFIQVTGTIGKTKTGQISLFSQSLKLLTKSLRPLPAARDVLTDPETIFRRRYLDLATNPQNRELFLRKAKFWQASRQYLSDHGFLEVEVPVLEHITGGADARPFTTHMNALDQTFYLRISTELYQKRLIGGGFEKIFTFGPNFRNEGLSDEHLTEFYQIEWYWAYADFEDNMRLTEDMFRSVAQSVWGKTEFTSHGHTFDLAKPWQKISYPDVIQDKLGINIFSDSKSKMLSVIKDHNIELSGAINKNRLIDNLWKIIRKDISGPAFLINEPKFMSPLAKSQLQNPDLTERYHVIIAGSELANGYSELNDPLDQLERFQEQQAARDAGDSEAQMLDIDYVEMLEYGMPPTSGHGHSERLFWYLEDISGRQGTLFPALRLKIDPLSQKIYGLKTTSKHSK